MWDSKVRVVSSPEMRTLPRVRLAGKLDRYVLSNGVEMPCLGFGMYMMPANEVGETALRLALELGFRHIDGARNYGNEAMEGRVLAESGIPRGELFLTGKLKNDEQGYEETLAAFERSCEDLQTDYLDLYLIHWPKVGGHEDEWRERVWGTWRAFEKLYAEGRVRAIGVSNFLVHHLETLLERANVMPQVNQIELNPGYQQRETVAWCEHAGVQLEAWAPLGRGHLLGNPVVTDIAGRLGKDAGQVCVRWSLQHGFVTMPKSLHPERVRSNSEVFDFELTEADMVALDALDGPDNYTFHPDRLDEWAERVARAHAESGV
ncbi:aldo/keto reductase [uncultured Parolsenella sp.]|uniref:aldo/keto reductase n=1 Tax=uncultured Parolsenella sp. TaxID=2083008 RepID=UPI0025D6C802|nr:aldo/keto reductase [uncultured Parolsenella sp.]